MIMSNTLYEKGEMVLIYYFMKRHNTYAEIKTNAQSYFDKGKYIFAKIKIIQLILCCLDNLIESL